MYGINGVPDNFVIDQNSEIVGRNVHGHPVEKLLNTLLQKPTEKAY
jgi:hypothetical protein